MRYDPQNDDPDQTRGGETTSDEAGNPFENIGENLRHGYEATKENLRHDYEEAKDNAQHETNKVKNNWD